MKTRNFIFFIFLAFTFNVSAHPPGLITKSACGSNSVQNSLIKVCLGNVGAGGFHSDRAPEVILSLFLTYQEDNGDSKVRVLPVTYGGAPGRFVLKYLVPEISVRDRGLKFAKILKFKLYSDQDHIFGIEGTFLKGEKFKVNFDQKLSADYFY